MAQDEIRTILGAFLFSGDDVEKKVSVLSGGEKSRLIIAKLLINPPNFLLLDEPTTHLDVDAVDALIKALNDYEGTLVFISHDIHFVRSVANVVFEVKDGKVRKFFGGRAYYLEKRKNVQLGEETPPQQEATILDYKQIKRKKEQEEEKRRSEEMQKRKAHNAHIRQLIKNLEKQKDELNLERSAKERAILHPRSYRDNASLEEYILRVEQIKKRINDIVREIERLNKQIIK